jgi:cellulose synthase/poly-beta-1,6-N-acetylglucosamine synthase-like glycosyltransferase
MTHLAPTRHARTSGGATLTDPGSAIDAAPVDTLDATSERLPRAGWRDAETPPSGLAAAHTASEILDRRQRQFLATAGLFFAAFLLIAPLATVITVMALTTAVYLSVVFQRLLITQRSLDDSDLVQVTDEEARAVPDECLPTYTVLVPAYREAEVIERLAGHLRELEYPRDRLDLKLLLEADDYETIDAAQRAAPDLQVVLVPPGEPRTKPKALNCGLLSAHGEYVTIYDAEDIPDPLQLRRAVVAFQRLPRDVACLQAQLTFHNSDRNIITRWFTIEYQMWFTLFLPGLSSMSAPVPLGGTSNHIRRDVLESIGSWDAYNVTEDADLGIRLYAQGWRTAVLDSETYEEPNSDFVNWVKQRSRWYKGYLQTWLVNLRHPIELGRAIGRGGFAQFNLFVGGTPVLSLLNPFFWLLTLVWFSGHASIIEQIFPAPLYHAALFCWIVGNLAVLYVTILAARRSGRSSLVWAACLVPVYWVMMSIAAIKAFWQVFAAPSFWEKTTHGLTVAEATPQPPAVTIEAAPFVAFPAREATPREPTTALARGNGGGAVAAPRPRANGNGNAGRAVAVGPWPPPPPPPRAGPGGGAPPRRQSPALPRGPHSRPTSLVDKSHVFAARRSIIASRFAAGLAFARSSRQPRCFCTGRCHRPRARPFAARARPDI